MASGHPSRQSTVFIVANTGFFVSNFLRHFVDHFGGLPAGVTVVAPAERGLTDKLHPHELAPLTTLSRKGSNPFREALFLGEIFRLYRRSRPSLVCHFTVKPNIYGSFVCALLGIPSVSVVSGLGYLFLNQGLVSRMGKLLYRAAFMFPRRVFFLNPEDHALFLEAGLVRAKQARLLPGTGVDAEWFRPQPPGIEPVRGEGVVFLMIARLLWDKGIREYFEAAEAFKKEDPSAEFWLLGPLDEGNPSCVPEAYVRAFSERGIIRYFPAVDDVRPYIAACDVAVLPSYREGVPRALLEPMAMGKPVIATDVPGCRDVVEDGLTGLLVAEKDAGALTQAFAKLTALDPDRRVVMGQRAREKVVRQFENHAVLRSFLEALER